jgi:rod shape determining protein RodA
MIERRLLPHLDWLLVGALVALTALGLATIYSVFRANPGTQFWTQAYAVGLGVVALVVCLFVDYRALAERSLFLYGGLLLTLLYVAFLGVVHQGARRWLPSIGGFSLQPSEFARIALALVLAKYFGESRRSARSTGQLVVAAAFLAGLFVLIIRQPDLGTAITLVPVFLGIVFLAGLPMRWLGVALVALVLSSPIIFWYGLRDYQRQRIVTAIDPWQDPLHTGYQQIQAKVTVGSGGLFGKGFESSTQGTYQFLPAAHNDFVFSVFAEEHGFIGVLGALGLYLFVIVRSFEAAKLAKDRVGAFLVAGIVSGFGFQVLYNITMSAGLAPVKGITLPLMSYGGSSLVATLVGFGLILNVRMRRFTN